MKREFSVAYEFYESWKELSSDDQELVSNAYKVMDSAYAPYSKFKVGASLRLSDNQIINGSNQENVAYPSGLCAERVALFYAGANYPDLEVNTLCVVAKGDLLPHEQLLSPCGGCRQVMMETESRQENNIRVILVSQNDNAVIFSSSKSLLPLAFGVE
jgi:cytidine deaminase